MIILKMRGQIKREPGYTTRLSFLMSDIAIQLSHFTMNFIVFVPVSVVTLAKYNPGA